MRAALGLLLVLLCALALAPDAAQAAVSAGIGADLGPGVIAASAVPFGLFAPAPGARGSAVALDKDEGGGGGSQNGNGSALTREEVQDMLKGRFGADVPEAMLTRLTDLTLRASRAEAERDALRTRLDQAKTPDGAVVLTGDEATAYAALKGRDGFADAPLAKATETLDAGADALTKLAELETRARQDAAFRKAGLDPDRVRKYLPALDARLDGEGDEAKAVAVIKKDGGAEETKPLDEVIQADHAEIADVLRADGSAPAQRGGSSAGATAGTMIPQRSASTGTKAPTPTADDIAAEKAKSGGYSM